ncbi:dockerin type I domain-containing protein [Pseudobacteroides cellulosolvens]|uniref:Dockerin domain-containing protein n=1 Tax=Pseudobacteroides cellulosolvens ATCC 35603 = DSM 2933 TaxID=398512 RepID=A0A0L6JVH1_9FIRM|nr:dockerin type I domain-containing protein [Pseudobacteroides cellulosolvens]KNY29699.1 hypothetical protein Bccel_4973 [Pseudobacteroides cellulosolvens ATCC 35603 = DSM 2933]
MTERQWHKKTSIGLVLFLIISLCSSYTIAQTRTLTDSVYASLDKQQIDAPMPIDYVLFSGSQTTDLYLRGQEVSISGNIHSNAGIKIGADRFNMNGICDSVKGHEIYSLAKPTDTCNFIDNGSVIKIPDISNEMIDAAFVYGKKVIHIYPNDYKNKITQPNIDLYFDANSSFKIGGSQVFTVDNDEIYFFHGNVIISNGVKFLGNGNIFATGDIDIRYGFDTSSGYASVYSSNGNIICDYLTNKLNANFYALKGDVRLIGNELDFTGYIIADTISLNCNRIKITAPTDNKPKDIFTTFYIPSPTPTPMSTSKIADVNADKVVNMSDVIIMASVFNSSKGDGVYIESYDLNSDGAINMNDIIVIAKNFNTIISD